MIDLNNSSKVSKYLKATEVAALLRIDRTTAYDLPLPWIRVGKRNAWRVATEEVEKFIADKTRNINPEAQP